MVHRERLHTISTLAFFKEETMNTFTDFGNFTSHGIGLDRLFNEISRRSAGGDPKYPPYNIVKLDTYRFLVELAVAGFSDKELKVEFADDLLKVSGNKDENTVEREYIHRGISARSFARSFVLSPDVKIGDVALEDGMLKIMMERELPDHKKPRTLEIKKHLEIESSVPDQELLTEEKRGVFPN